MAKKEVQKSTWTPEQDARLRKALEDAQGTQSWSAIARTAFPDGEYNKADCTEVSFIVLLRCPVPLQLET